MKIELCGGAKRCAPSAAVVVTVAFVAALAVLAVLAAVAILRTVIHVIAVELVCERLEQDRPRRAARTNCAATMFHRALAAATVPLVTYVVVAVPLSVVRCRAAPLQQAGPLGVTPASERPGGKRLRRR